MGGTFSEAPLDLGGGPLPHVGDSTLFVARFDSSGGYRWARSFGTVDKTQNMGKVAFDPSGAVVFSGRAEELDFGGGTRSGFFLAKLAGATGGHTWSKGFLATGTSGRLNLSLDPQGNAVIAGTFVGTINLGGAPLIGSVRVSAFVAKFDSSGAHQWSKAFAARGPNASDEGSANADGVSSDSCGNLFLSGGFGVRSAEATLEFGMTRLVAPFVSGGNYIFLAKLSPSGDGIWAKSFLANGMGGSNAGILSGAPSAENASGPTMAAQLVGSSMFGFQESVNFGGGTLTNSGETSAVIASFDGQGNHRWSYATGLPSTTIASVQASHAVASSVDGVVFVGTFGDCSSAACMTSPPGKNVVLAGRTLTAIGGRDMYMFRLAP